jgi:rare lipoprotein A
MFCRLVHVNVIALMGLGLLISGCAETTLLVHNVKKIKSVVAKTAPVIGHYKIGKAYQIKDVWYYPAENDSYVETGIASWYGPNFHNKKTANGEIFNQFDVSAAHRTLPIPSVVQVTNLTNGRSLIVRVNDRGPFAHGRIIDMSRRGAQLLGFEKAGTARVRVAFLANESARLKALALAGKPSPLSAAGQVAAAAPVPQSSPSIAVSATGLAPLAGKPSSPAAPVTSKAVVSKPAGGKSIVEMTRNAARQTVFQGDIEKTQIYVQAGAFRNESNALQLVKILAPIAPVIVSPAMIDGRAFFRVRLGPVNSVDQGDSILATLIEKGYPGARIVVD